MKGDYGRRWVAILVLIVPISLRQEFFLLFHPILFTTPVLAKANSSFITFVALCVSDNDQTLCDTVLTVE